MCSLSSLTPSIKTMNNKINNLRRLLEELVMMGRSLSKYWMNNPLLLVLEL